MRHQEVIVEGRILKDVGQVHQVQVFGGPSLLPAVVVHVGVLVLVLVVVVIVIIVVIVVVDVH